MDTTKGHVEQQHRVSQKDAHDDACVDDTRRNNEQQEEAGGPVLVPIDPHSCTAQEEAVCGDVEEDGLEPGGIFTLEKVEEGSKLIHRMVADGSWLEAIWGKVNEPCRGFVIQFFRMSRIGKKLNL